VISERIRNLEKEENSITKLIADAQNKHYKEGSIGMETFNAIMSQYTTRISKIRQLRIRLRHRRVRLLKSSEVLKDLGEERKDVIDMLKKIQNDYFVERKISKDAYNKQTKIYNDRLSEIEDEQLTLETMLARKGNFKRKIVKQLKKNGKNLGKNQVEKLFSKIKEGRVWSRKSKR
jgi:vacuolar-type H+-ATPase subunit I/STV1